MGNMWDLPEQNYPIRKKKARVQKEPELADTTQKIMETTSDFMLGAAGITVMAGMGGALIGALKPK